MVVRESIKTLCLGFPWWYHGEDFVFQSRGREFDPWSGARIPQAKKTPRHKTEKQYCNKFNEDLKIDHNEKILKKKTRNYLPEEAGKERLTSCGMGFSGWNNKRAGMGELCFCGSEIQKLVEE